MPTMEQVSTLCMISILIPDKKTGGRGGFFQKINADLEILQMKMQTTYQRRHQ